MRINDLFEDLLQSVYTRSHSGMLVGFEKAYNQMVKDTGKALWRGMLQVAASGFGKGVLITAGVIMAGFGLWGGFDAFANTLPIEEGLVNGLKHGFGLLIRPVGLITLAMGGTMGAVSSVHKAHSRITASVAMAKAEQMGLTQQLQQAQAAAMESEAPAKEKPWQQQEAGMSFAAREEQRRKEKTFGEQMGVT